MANSVGANTKGAVDAIGLFYKLEKFSYSCSELNIPKRVHASFFSSWEPR